MSVGQPSFAPVKSDPDAGVGEVVLFGKRQHLLVQVFRVQKFWKVKFEGVQGLEDALHVIIPEWNAALVQTDGFKCAIAVPEGAVFRGNDSLIRLVEFTIMNEEWGHPISR